MRSLLPDVCICPVNANVLSCIVVVCGSEEQKAGSVQRQVEWSVSETGSRVYWRSSGAGRGRMQS